VLHRAPDDNGRHNFEDAMDNRGLRELELRGRLAESEEYNDDHGGSGEGGGHP
jgi:hypothetical protein